MKHYSTGRINASNKLMRNAISKEEQLEQHVLSQSGARVRLSFDEKQVCLVLSDDYAGFVLARSVLKSKGIKEVVKG